MGLIILIICGWLVIGFASHLIMVYKKGQNVTVGDVIECVFISLTGLIALAVMLSFKIKDNWDKKLF